MARDLAAISAQYGVRQTVLTLIGSGPPVQLCDENAKRVSLILGKKSGYDIYISIDPNDPAGTGYQIGTDSSERFYFDKDGPLCQQAWFGQCPGTGGTVTVIEVWKVN